MLNGKEGRLLRRNNDKDTRMKINILLCDDDKDFLQRLTEIVTSQPLPPGISVCVTKSAHSSAITDRQLSQYQIMFLDIDMDERSGMDIARRVRELHLDTVIIFVTNYPEFSMEGYEVRAFRYLLKQEMQQKLPLYFRDALAEIPHDKKELRFSVNAEPYRVAYKDMPALPKEHRWCSRNERGRKEACALQKIFWTWIISRNFLGMTAAVFVCRSPARAIVLCV